MALNLDKTFQSTFTRSHSRTLPKYIDNNMPTVHARTWTNENSQERGQTYGRETICVVRFDLNVLVDVISWTPRWDNADAEIKPPPPSTSGSPDLSKGITSC